MAMRQILCLGIGVEKQMKTSTPIMYVCPHIQVIASLLALTRTSSQRETCVN